jgi:hypothetical protein
VHRALRVLREYKVNQERPVPRDLPVLPVPQEVRDRLARLDRMERMVLLVLMELQVRRDLPDQLALKDPKEILETPALLVLLDRRALMELLELMVRPYETAQESLHRGWE